MKLTSIVAASCFMAILAPAAMAQDVFDFGAQTPGTFLQPGQTLTADNDPSQKATVGITSATPTIAYEFVDNGPPGNPNFGTNLYPAPPLVSDTVLVNADGSPTTTLSLTFAQPISSLSLQFAIVNGTLNNVPVNTLTLSGGDMPDTSSGTYNPTSFNFEGSLSTSTATGTFDTATITFQGLPANDFGYTIGDIITSPAVAVPEPGIVALVLAGILPAVGLLRRRIR